MNTQTVSAEFKELNCKDEYDSLLVGDLEYNY